MKLARVGLLLLFLFVTQCLLACAHDKEAKRRKGKGRNRGESRDGDDHRKAQASPVEGRKQERKGSAPKSGKIVGKNKEECKWTLRGEETGERNLRLDCKKDHSDYWCEFTGHPSTCQKYGSNVKTYWKQVTRALKRKADCSDPSAVLKANLCKSTKAALMKMSRSSLLPAAAADQKDPKASDATEGGERPDIEQITAENCSEKWGSLCKFMLLAFEG
ncbi:fibroblast growth factor-binding protein 2 [Amblyraja radiata]|uniref:fibroblast growth factor-binding protein 2 n=1 Tax=Amblyraja radiata TaxID=386614 RepID=UPI0014033CAD|nr:fibroblast growth factor-binding protein 2 [Amblyraja radiata]XP_032881656.1 fibroblast growth factor-binding protein 2 [Amblyraja radiata]